MCLPKICLLTANRSRYRKSCLQPITMLLITGVLKQQLNMSKFHPLDSLKAGQSQKACLGTVQ